MLPSSPAAPPASMWLPPPTPSRGALAACPGFSYLPGLSHLRIEDGTPSPLTPPPSLPHHFPLNLWPFIFHGACPSLGCESRRGRDLGWWLSDVHPAFPSTPGTVVLEWSESECTSLHWAFHCPVFFQEALVPSSEISHYSHSACFAWSPLAFQAKHCLPLLQ